MKLTKQQIDIICPEHGRTSCSDDNRANGYYNITEDMLQDVVVKRVLTPPRCNRCFLLDHIDNELDNRLIITTNISISVKEPKFRITSDSEIEP